MTGLLEYSEDSTLLHRVNPISKVAFAVAVCIATFLANEYLTLVFLLALVLLAGVYAGVGKKAVSLLLAFSSLGALMFLVQTVIVRAGTPVFLWVTDRGADTGAHVALRLVTFALPLVLMLTVTRLTDLTNAAVEVLHLPYRYAFTITTALRFVPIFSSEMSRIVEAQTARGVEFDSGNPLRKLGLMMPLAAPLLITSVSKADDTALAAEQRGFYLRTRESSYKRYPMAARDYAIFSLCLVVIVLGAIF